MAGVSLALIGGSGLERFAELARARSIRVRTRYGEPSDAIAIGSVEYYNGDARTIAFLPRHGADHRLPPHRIPYRANMAALKKLGVVRIVATCIAGSLQARIRPGDMVIPDQFVDLTWGRVDEPDEPIASKRLVHLPMAAPYCAELSAALVRQARRMKLRTHKRGTVAVVQGPRFSTRAEARWFSAQGWDLINMTQYPESYYARMFGICYAAVAGVTDYAPGVRSAHEIRSGRSVRHVLVVFRRLVQQQRELVRNVLATVSLERGCECGRPLPLEYYKEQETVGPNGARRRTR